MKEKVFTAIVFGIIIVIGLVAVGFGLQVASYFLFRMVFE